MVAKTVLITGCSEGGLGDVLARAFHAKGYRVFATARNPKKIAHFASLGIETGLLDVQSSTSIEKCVAEISTKTGGRLDILLNNSGAGYSMPIADVELDKARELFDLNVWAVVAVTQAFLPLLLRAAPGAMVVNNASIAGVVNLPMQGVYNASKAAIISLTETLKFELEPFGVRVVTLHTGSVKSLFFVNMENKETVKLPEGSIYSPARSTLEGIMGGAEVEKGMMDATQWAKKVVGDLTVSKPSDRIWRGGSAWLVWAGRAFFPHWFFDSLLKKMGGMYFLEAKLKEEQKTR